MTVATGQIKPLCSQVVLLFSNMLLDPQPLCAVICDELFTFSTFSTVKSSVSGVATILPGVSISPLGRSCQMIKDEQQFII